MVEILATSTWTRTRLPYAALIVLVISFGLGVRATAEHLPAFIAQYAPDALWALMVFALVVLIGPRLRTWQAACYAWSFAVFIECSQLYQAPWLNSVRATRIGGLLLGFGFLWSDLLCYTLGIAIGVLIDNRLRAVASNTKART